MIQEPHPLATDTVDDLFREQAQKQRRPEFNPYNALLYLDPPVDPLPHRCQAKIKPIPGPIVFHRADEVGELLTDVTQPVVDPALGFVAAQ